MPRLRTTPNGFNEWLVVETVDWARAHGYERVSLNFAPFAALLTPQAELSRLQRVERRALLALKGRFQLDNLLVFNRKFFPSWERRFLVYERRRDYVVVASAPEVREVTIESTTYPVAESGQTARSFSFSATEHCREEIAHTLDADARTGAKVADAVVVLSGPRQEVADPASLAVDETIVVPPEHRASFVVRQLLSEMLKPVQADRVLEESLTLETIDLCYRPIWAFEFHWQSSRLLERCFQVKIFPTEVRGKDELLAREIDAAGQAHADTLARQFRSRSHQLTDAWQQFGYELFGIGGSC